MIGWYGQMIRFCWHSLWLCCIIFLFLFYFFYFFYIFMYFCVYFVHVVYFSWFCVLFYCCFTWFLNVDTLVLLVVSFSPDDLETTSKTRCIDIKRTRRSQIPFGWCWEAWQNHINSYLLGFNVVSLWFSALTAPHFWGTNFTFNGLLRSAETRESAEDWSVLWWFAQSFMDCKFAGREE